MFSVNGRVNALLETVRSESLGTHRVASSRLSCGKEGLAECPKAWLQAQRLLAMDT